nr:MAG TPA: hypothetical protein [Caudoviricetes sp.]
MPAYARWLCPRDIGEIGMARVDGRQMLFFCF